MKTLRPLIFIVCCAGLFYGLFRETPPPQVFHQSDKFGHIAGFALMTAVGLWAFPRKAVIWFLLPVTLLALSAEYLQEQLLPYRHFSIEDMYANLAGIAVITLPWLIWQLARNKAHQDKLSAHPFSEKQS